MEAEVVDYNVQGPKDIDIRKVPARFFVGVAKMKGDWLQCLHPGSPCVVYSRLGIELLYTFSYIHHQILFELYMVIWFVKINSSR